MFEIKGSHIAELSDEDLRTLVGLLCESELRSHGLSASAVTWGGNQNAPDGGIDVRVRIQVGKAPGGFIPRRSIGFQVKKTDFTAGLIAPEMRPSGQLRESIRSLVDDCGAYIIASSGSDVSDSALTDRVNAMRSVVADQVGHADLHIDFYDRNRLATWTRGHPGLVVWIRQKIGRGISGWQPYGSWAVSPDGVEDEYLLDDRARLHAGINDERGIDVTHGIDRIRDILRECRGVVRLVGLSGVGKTRLVQALFDVRVGKNPLDPALVVYTDMNDNPSPQPTGMISDLIASRTRAIIVVDNCAPDLHRRITEICRASDSPISTITVEYDVQEDEPEGTEVFRLEPSSGDLVSNLIARRFPTMTRLDVDRIAELSDGNARVALALANTLERHESVAGLQDEALFKRLFYQRQEHDNSLLKAAQACALLYSFQGEALSGEDAELPKIAALVGMTAQQLYAKVAQLKQRDLVQRRNVWRAILPHAVANRLAKMALREIPVELIEQQLNTERLMKSFSRRLGYLHESDEAKRFAEKWLAKNGLLVDVGRLNEFGLAMFCNIAPVSPEAILAAIEAALSGSNARWLIDEQGRRSRLGTILRSIAYDALLFDRCVAAMISLALAEPSDGRTHPISGALEELCHLYLSGTHASIEQRAKVVDGCLRSNEPKKRSLGLRLLGALLQADHFSGTHSFQFGAWGRDYGYWPNSREERAHWFVIALELARKFVSQDGEIASVIRSKVAECLRSIWFLGPEVQEQFEATAREITGKCYWQEGWIAVRAVLARPLDKVDFAAVERLHAFEGSLHPRNVTEQVRAVVLSQSWGALDYAEMDDHDGIEPEKLTAKYERANTLAEELGRVVCIDEKAFKVLLPDLVVGDAGRLFPFGRGLALGSTEQRLVWDLITRAFIDAEEGKRNAGALIGFLNGLSTLDEQLCESLLEEAVAHEVLGAWFPILQTSIAISVAGADRLKRAARLAIAEVGAFRSLGWGRSSDAISGGDLRTIILSIAKRENGYEVATDILSKRFYSDRDQKREHPSEIVDAGRSLLSDPVFNGRDSMHDYRLSRIADVCLQGAGGSGAAQRLCVRIKHGFSDGTFSAYGHEQLLQSLFRLQPRIALDNFLERAPESDGLRSFIYDFGFGSDLRKKPIDEVPLEEVLRWCDEKPAERYPVISQAISYYAAPKDAGVGWTPLALEMLKRAPDPLDVLRIFVKRFSPRSWSGSRAAVIESRLSLLDRLDDLESSSLAEYIARVRLQLVDDIARERKWENERDSARDERFE